MRENMPPSIEQKALPAVLSGAGDIYRLFFERAPFGMILLNPRGTIVAANAKVFSLTGLRREELVGKNVFRLALALRADVPKVIKAFRDAILRKGPDRYEFAFTGRNGRKTIVVTNHAPIVEERRAIGLAAIFEDITERARNAQALVRSESKLRNMLGAMNDLVFEFDREARFTFSHVPAGVGLYRPPKEFIGKRHAEVMPPHVDKVFSRAFRKCRAGEIAEYEYSLGADGKKKSFMAKLSPEFEGGKFSGAVAVVRDISIRQEAENRLKESEEKYRLISEFLPVVAYSALPDDRSTNLFISGKVREMTGYGEDEFLKDPDLWNWILHPDDRDCVWREIKDHRRKRGPLDVEYRIIARSGAVKWIRDKATPLLDERGRIAKIVGFTEDVTARKNLEEHLLRAQKMEVAGRMASGLVHDLNSLLTALSGYAELVARRLPGGKSDPDLVGIRRTVLEAEELTRALLVFSRERRSGRRRLLLGALARVLRPLLARLLGRRVRLSLRFARNLWPVQADPAETRRILINLALNAREAMPRGGKFVIEARNVVLENRSRPVPPGRYVMLSVADTGAGMDAATKERLFEPFFSTKNRSTNTGLGLYTIYAVVQRMGGHIEVESEPGEGATFRIFLPQVREHRA